MTMLLALIYSLLYFIFVFLLGGTLKPSIFESGISRATPPQPAPSSPSYSILEICARTSNAAPATKSWLPFAAHQPMRLDSNVSLLWCVPFSSSARVLLNVDRYSAQPDTKSGWIVIKSEKEHPKGTVR